MSDFRLFQFFILDGTGNPHTNPETCWQLQGRPKMPSFSNANWIQIGFGVFQGKSWEIPVSKHMELSFDLISVEFNFLKSFPGKKGGCWPLRLFDVLVSIYWFTRGVEIGSC